MWPPAPALTARHLSRCVLLENRERMLEHMPRQAVCAELGILRGDFSATILRLTQPTRLHLIDIDDSAVKAATSRFSQEILNGTVRLHRGDSADTMMTMPEGYFDWVYIDGDHSHEGVRRDLESARLKLKADGIIALNDYIYFGPSDFVKYGVVEAVNEFCLKHDFELLFFALSGRMYNDVAIRRIGDATAARP